jgi:hypothetical protein
MGKLEQERMMRDIGRLIYGKDEPTFSFEKFMKSVQEAPEIDARLTGGAENG